MQYTVYLMRNNLQALERPPPLADQVYVTLREYLRSGRVATGEALQEASLATQLGVSRTPVREALARLASDGLIVGEGRSFSVPALTDADIEDIYELRFLLEPQALREIAESRPDARTLAPLRRALDDMAAAHASGDGAEFMEANYRFRAGWMAHVPNRRLGRAIELYADHVRYLRAFTLGDADVRAAVMAGLERLYAALSAGDGAGAADAMLAHLGKAKAILLERKS